MKYQSIFAVVLFLLSIIGCNGNDYEIKTKTYDFTSLQGSELSDPSARQVYFVLPPGYDKPENAAKQYPAIYMLHGFKSTYSEIRSWAEIVKSESQLLHGMGQIQDMIVVLPHAGTSLCGEASELECGSFYRNSSVTGNYKTYILEELIAKVDNDPDFRTIPERSKRAITGGSMGGYGAIMLAMESNVESSGSGKFRSVASHSGLLSLELALPMLANPPVWARGWVNDHVIPSLTAAFSERESLGLEYDEATGEISKNEEVWEKWLENDPLTFLKDHGASTFNETSIYIDCGESDELGFAEHAQVFFDKLDELGIDCTFEIYQYTFTEIDPLDNIMSGHAFIKYRVGESLKFHSNNLSRAE